MKALTGLVGVALCLVLCGCEDKAAKQENVELKAKLNALEGDRAKTFRELEDARAEVAKLIPDAKRGRELPIKVTQRTAMMGSGSVLQIQNLSPRTLPIALKFYSPTFRKTNVFERVLQPVAIMASPIEIGHAEGWTVAPGDQVEIMSDGFDPLRKDL